MANQVLGFEHKVIRPLKALTKTPERWLLAVSGGVDSMVMAEVLRRWRKALKIEIGIAYIHHGEQAASVQKAYRHRAQQFVGRWCQSHQILFFTNPAQEMSLNSEAELRDYRQKWLESWADEFSADRIVLAHHRDDLIETRMMRLIRGTSGYGLAGMRLAAGKKLRPLLEVSRAEIEAYAAARDIDFVTDPSNQKTESLRNWMRHEWLPTLEHRQPGALRALARSLSLLTTPVVAPAENNAGPQLVGLRRKEMKNVSFERRELMVATYLRDLGIKNYGQSHVREILKRIDTRRKNLTFEMLGLVFRVTPDLLWASRV